MNAYFLFKVPYFISASPYALLVPHAVSVRPPNHPPPPSLTLTPAENDSQSIFTHSQHGPPIFPLFQTTHLLFPNLLSPPPTPTVSLL